MFSVLACFYKTTN